MIRTCFVCGTKNRIPAARLDQKARCGRCQTHFPALAEPVELASAQEVDELIRTSSVPVVMDFWAPWCAPCRAMGPELARLARSLAGQVVVAKVDTEALPDVGGRFGIRAVPTVVLLQEGREVHRLMGAQSAASLQAQLGLAGAGG